MAKLIQWLHLWVLDIRAAWRIEHGWCPWCNSSPPDPSCLVCFGDYDYGPDATDAKRELWSYRWVASTQ